MPPPNPVNPADVPLPSLGEGVKGAKLVRWLVEVGDSVARDQTLAKLETDKAVVEIPSPRAGVITKLHAARGQFVNVNDPLVTLEP